MNFEALRSNGTTTTIGTQLAKTGEAQPLSFEALRSDGTTTTVGMQLATTAEAQPPAPAEERAIAGEETWYLPGRAGGFLVTEETALKLTALLAAFNVLATDVAMFPLDVFQRLPDGTREERREHTVDMFFSRSPDLVRTPLNWRRTWVYHALRHGNGYAEIQRKGNGSPYALHLLDPRTTKPERTALGDGYRLGNGEWLPAGNVLHISGLGFDGLQGYNYIRMLDEAIAVGLGAQSFGLEYFVNGAEPSGVIETPQKLGPEAIKNLRMGWHRDHGAGRRHGTAVLEQGAKYNQISTDPEKTQLLETRKFEVLDVIRPWRVPPHKVGDFSQAHLSNIEASNLDYLMTALMGWLVSIEQECNLKLFSLAEYKAGFYVEHNVASLLRGDLATRYEAYATALDRGWMNRDEVRAKENMNPIGAKMGGQKYLVQMQNIPLDKAGSLATLKPAGGGSPPPKADPPKADDSKPADPKPADPIEPAGSPADTPPGTDPIFDLKRLLNDAATGQLPIATVKAVILATYPFEADQVDAMVDPLATFKPAQ
ncbi:phage portal protein [Singulisphaera sp. PoT]|uniref:phage portal protein n=1 Tax=Singulisphaera sp. PoT TaxID=3411797 RepID=UPI003BF5ECAB